MTIVADTKRRKKRQATFGFTPGSLYETLFKEQVDFLLDPNTLAAASCTRRGGKSYACSVHLAETALTNPGSFSLYIALTRESASNIMAHLVTKQLNKAGLVEDGGFTYNRTSLTFTLFNGSTIRLTGAEGENSIDRLLGVPYSAVIIDEAQSFDDHLKILVYETLMVTVAECRGKIRLIGTPGRVPKGFFYDVVSSVESERKWGVHSWSWRNNLHIANLIEEQVTEMVKSNPLVDSNFSRKSL